MKQEQGDAPQWQIGSLKQLLANNHFLIFNDAFAKFQAAYPHPPYLPFGIGSLPPLLKINALGCSFSVRITGWADCKVRSMLCSVFCTS